MSLKVESVSFAYKRRKHALSDLTFSLEEFPAVVLGPNGAGKSTLFGLLTTRLRPRRGHVEINGVDSRTRSGRRQLRSSVGWLPQDVKAVPGLRVREQVAYMGWLKGMPSAKAWDAAEGALDMVGLLDESLSSAGELSGGQMRRLGIAQALVHAPTILVLDEPYAGLDPNQRATLRELLIDLARFVSIIVSTHQTEDLSEIYKSVVVIDRGSLAFAGSEPEFLKAAGETPAHGSRAEAAYRRIVGATAQ